VTTTALPAPGRLRVARGYLALTKPRIIELLLVTTVPPMVLAARGLPSVGLVAATLAGGSLAAGAANTINCYVDRDVDALMHRTRSRPLAEHRIAPVNALRFGIALTVAATALLALAVNPVSALLADAAIAVYVFVYTLGLKRRTPHNIVIGGAAGCFPALIGWSAVTGTVGWPAAVLFLVVFLWTPPHFWALALRFRQPAAHPPGGPRLRGGGRGTGRGVPGGGAAPGSTRPAGAGPPTDAAVPPLHQLSGAAVRGCRRRAAHLTARHRPAGHRPAQDAPRNGAGPDGRLMPGVGTLFLGGPPREERQP
jgi:hypothetical protein